MPSTASPRRSRRRNPGRRRGHTFVSCLYDLERREHIGRRPIAFFRQHAELVLGLEAPLVVFADPELVRWLRAARRARGLQHLTQVIERPLEALDLHAVLPTISRFPTFANADPRGTPRHQIVEWSKFDLLREVIDADPFQTDHFAWIDFGIGHVARPPSRLPQPSERVAALQMRAVAPAELTDRLEFMGYERGRIAGGFFRGPADALLRLIAAFEGELASVLASRFRPNEQMVLSWLSAARPELFDFYYGDYSSILVNWDFVRRDVETVFRNLVHCRLMSLWGESLRICERLEASLAAGALTLTADGQARLFDEQFIAAWHGGRPDVAHLARRRLIGELAETSYFVLHERRLRENLAQLPALNPPPQRIHVRKSRRRPEVSVIIPVHDGEATLERAVASVLAQTRGDLEVLVVDDGSTDRSAAIAKRLAARDPRVRVIARRECAGNPATPRDDGIAAARGRFIALLDQDDCWLPEKLAAQLPLFEDPTVAVVYSDAYLVLDEGVRGAAGPPRTLRAGNLPVGDISHALTKEDCVPALTAVVRREWIDRTGRFDRHHLVGADDYYYWLRISLSGGRFAAVAEPTAVHFNHPASLGRTRPEACGDSLQRMWRALAEEFPGATPSASAPDRRASRAVPARDTPASPSSTAAAPPTRASAGRTD